MNEATQAVEVTAVFKADDSDFAKVVALVEQDCNALSTLSETGSGIKGSLIALAEPLQAEGLDRKDVKAACRRFMLDVFVRLNPAQVEFMTENPDGSLYKITKEGDAEPNARLNRIINASVNALYGETTKAKRSKMVDVTDAEIIQQIMGDGEVDMETAFAACERIRAIEGFTARKRVKVEAA